MGVYSFREDKIYLILGYKEIQPTPEMLGGLNY